MTVKLALLLGLAALTTCHADPTPPAEPRAVVYRFDVASAHYAAAYPVSVAPTASGDRYCFTARSQGFNHIVVTAPGKLKAGHEYTAIIHYEVVTAPAFPNYFFMFGRSRQLGTEHDVWRDWLGEPGVKGVAMLPLTIQEGADWAVYVGCKGPAQILIDSFEVVEGLGYTFVPAVPGPAAAVKPAALAARPLPTGSVPFTIEPPRLPQVPVTVSATDFGLTPDPATGRVSDAVAAANLTALKKALAACRHKQASLLNIPTGVYRFAGKESVPFDDLTDLTLDGNGSEFIFETLHTGTAVVSVGHDTRCVIKNLVIDWDWSVIPLGSMCKVVAVSPDKLQADLAFPDLAPAEVEQLKTAPWQQMFPMDPATFRLTSLLRLPVAPRKFETLAPGTLRVTFKAPVPLVAGQVYCIRHMYYEMGAFRVGDVHHLLFDNVSIYSVPGMGWVTRGDADHWGLHNCRIVRRPGTRRPFSTSADGFHVLESQGCLLVDGCEFSGSGDDSINIHDNIAEGVHRDADRALTLVANTKFRMKVAVGDTLELRHADFAPLGFSTKVTGVTFVGNATKLTVADPLPATLLEQTIVLNKRYDTANVRIVHCRFHDTGGRGILLGASNATVEDNVFDHTRAVAIQLHTEIVGTLWAEGHGCANVVIRGNQFLDANTQCKFDGAVIYARSNIPAGSTGYPLFHDVLIEGNRFVNCPGPAVSLASCQDFTVINNTLENNAGVTGASALSAAVVAELSSDIVVSGNRWKAGSPSAKPGVVYDPATCRGVVAPGNAVVAASGAP